jgi:hypothetical protein
MNVIRNDLPKDLKDFFKRLEDYLDTKLYFYGSVNRPDYDHGKSDIDVAVFTDNEYSTMVKIQHFLHVKRNAFDKVVWKLEGEMIYGYKIKCEKYINYKCEIAIYNNEFKKTLLADMRNYNVIPVHIGILLYILKMLHYTVPLLSSKTYSDYKRLLFNKLMINKQDTVFYLMKQS